MSPVPPTVLRDGLAVIALAVIAWLELGWFVERADVTCEGRDDRSVTCTVTHHNRYRTREQSIADVIGVTVRERENPMGSVDYELRVLTASGSGGPLPTPRFHFRHSADREAERFTALLALAPGERFTEQTVPPPSTAQLVVPWFSMMLMTAFGLGVAFAVVEIGLGALRSAVRDRWRRARGRR